MFRIDIPELVAISRKNAVTSTTVTGGGAAPLTITFPADSLTNKEWLTLFIAQAIPVDTAPTAGVVTVTDGTTTGFLTDWLGQQVYQNLLINKVSRHNGRDVPIHVHQSGAGAQHLFVNFAKQIPHILQNVGL